MGSDEDESGRRGDEGGRDGFRFTRRQVIGAGAAGAAALMAGRMDPAAAADGYHSPRWWQWGGKFSSETQRVLTSILVSGMGAANIPGLEVGIWVPGQGGLVEALGTSDHLNGTPLSTSDHFRIASITKSFVATAVLQLVDQRRLALSTTIDTFVDDIPNGSEITIAQLLNMTSGIYDYVNDPDLTTEETANPLLHFGLSDVIQIINNHEPLFAPGTDVAYDNSNYYLLGVILEQITDSSLAEVIGNMVLQPLGLDQTTYPTDATIPSPFSRGYFSRPNLDLRDVTASNPAFAGGAGAMISTLGDLMVWARALATGSLLSPTTQAMRLQTGVLVETPKVTVAYGMGITNINGFLGHDGAIVGYGSLVLYLPSSGATIVLMGNNNDNNAPAPLAIGLAVAAYLFPAQFPNGL